jgi:hypothetical protein
MFNLETRSRKSQFVQFSIKTNAENYAKFQKEKKSEKRVKN